MSGLQCKWRAPPTGVSVTHPTGNLDLSERAPGDTSHSLSEKGCEVSGRPAAVVGRARVVRGALVRPGAGLVHVFLVFERVIVTRHTRDLGD